MNNWTEEMINEVLQLDEETPCGTGDRTVNAGSILVNSIRENCSVYNFPVHNIFRIWKESTDKKAVEKMFYELVGMEFDSYLMKCKKEISRNED